MTAGGLRTGWTTGTCAAAAAKAATTGLLTGEVPAFVEVTLPSGDRVGFAVEPEGDSRAVVVKDAGDDPDCTDGARVTAEATFADESPAPLAPTGDTSFPYRQLSVPSSCRLVAGPGVGTVTKPGLGLAVGAPAINPVPQRMIRAALTEIAGVDDRQFDDRHLVIMFSVPRGKAMAEKTTNARLGIVGGISILGTTGIVRPFSTAAYRASVVQQIDVAGAQGEDSVVLATGSRSQKAATQLLPDLDPVCFVEVGDFTGVALRRAANAGIRRATFVGMAGKITKLAAGVVMTHFHRSKVDGDVLAAAARAAGAPADVVSAATETATARHFFETCVSLGATAPLDRLCALARATCEAHTDGAVAVDVVMVDFDGAGVVARG
ncbi:MAG TPA: cobalt-precorrin-5B (C(1))-methyltransferase CbiD [Acidimicrobiales bacterium]|nr:cobalt-precorrin-5B (C(1))-methyltransferase CbiD [Acidimicrobiales bacterium]